MRLEKLSDDLKRLREAIEAVEKTLAPMRAEHDPLASHIFVSRRNYQKMDDTSESGRRKHNEADFSYRRACELGFRGKFEDWVRLL